MSNNHPNRTKAAARRREAREGGEGEALPLGSGHYPGGGPSPSPTPRRAMPGISIRRVGEAADDLAEAVRGLSAVEIEQLRAAGLDPVQLAQQAGSFADAVLGD